MRFYIKIIALTVLFVVLSQLSQLCVLRYRIADEQERIDKINAQILTCVQSGDKQGYWVLLARINAERKLSEVLMAEWNDIPLSQLQGRLSRA